MLGLYGSTPMLIGMTIILILAALIKAAIAHVNHDNKTRGVLRNSTLTTQERRAHGRDTHLPVIILALSVGFALFIFFHAYYLTIGSMDRFVQYDDNATHLAMIEAGSKLGNYSTIKPAYNLPNDPNGISEATYYPSGFHTIPALSCALTGVNAAISENASAVIYTCFAFPLGITALVYLSSSKNPLAAAATIPMSFASVAFPLRMLTVHAPFPNIAGFSLMPLFCVAFILTFDLNETNWRKLAVPLVLITLSLGFVHPNALIFGCIFIFPYFLFNYIPQITRLISTKRSIKNPVILRTALQLAFIALAIFLWIFLNKASFMNNIVSFLWAWSESLPDALIDIASGALLLGKAQYAFGLLTLIGAATCAFNKRTAWLSISYMFIASIYLGTAVGNEAVKSFIAGFWYTDPERLAAMLAIAMIPLASIGIYYFTRTCSNVLYSVHRKLVKHRRNLCRTSIESAFLIVIITIFTLANYQPLAGKPGMEVNTAWAQNYYDLQNCTIQTPPNPYTESERTFVRRVQNLIGNDLVLNQPYDGSTFAYSVDGLNAYYPYRPSENDSVTSKTIRTNLRNYATDLDVQNAVNAIDAKWLLVLDKSEFQLSPDGKSYVSANLSYSVDDWEGFVGIDSDTPGFTLVLQEGSCKLYRITSDI